MLRYIFLLAYLAFAGIGQLAAQEPPVPYFEGSLQFLIELKGSNSGMILENEPPNKMLMHIKGGDYIIQLHGGKYPKTAMFVADSNYEYTVDMASKFAYRYSPYYDRVSSNRKPPVAKATGKTQEIKGLLCEEYKMKRDSTIFTYYVHDDYRVNTTLFPQKPRAKASFLIKGLDGRIPLKTIKQQKGLIVTTLLAKATRREFDKSQFMIPPGFKVKKRDYRF